MGLTALESVDASANQLKRGGVCALAKACARKPALSLLALDENEVSDAGVEALKVRAVWSRWPAACWQRMPSGLGWLCICGAESLAVLAGYGLSGRRLGRHTASASGAWSCPRHCGRLRLPLCSLQDIMRRIGKPEALGPLDENMPDEDDEEEGAENDGIELDDVAGDDLAAAMGKAHI